MTDKITEPMTPTDLDPVPHTPIAGNWRDDDAEVYEDDFEHADSGPEKASGVAHPAKEIKVTTRLLCRSENVGTVAGSVVDPIMLLPHDPNRKSLTIQPYSAAVQSFRIASTKSDVFNGTVMTSTPGAPVISLDGHTGALWAYSTDGASILVSVVAVTE